MKMKGFILFLMLVLVIQIGYEIKPCFAEQDKDILEIKKVLEKFLDGLVYRDLDSMMKEVSTSINYSFTSDDKVIDYAKFKSDLEKVLNGLSKTYVDYSISELQLDNLDIRDNKATVEIEYSWKGFNLDSVKYDSGKRKRIVTLAKENGSWKITQLRRLEQSE